MRHERQVTFGWSGARPLGQARAQGRGETSPEPQPSPSAPQEDRPSDARGLPPPAPLPPDGELWDVHAAARFLRRSVSWVYHRAEDGTLPVKRLAGWGVRFIPSELRAWVESGGGRRGR